LASYEELIRYHDEQTWRDYFEKELGELYSAVKGFLDLRDELVASFSGRPVSEIIAESEEYKKMLFGGVVLEDGPFKERALAKFYAEVMGIRVKDLDKVISRLKEGVPLEDATQDIECEFLETDVVKCVKTIFETLKKIFFSLQNTIKIPEAKQYNALNAQSGLKALNDIINAARRLLPHYNPCSFFVISLYSIPRLFVMKQYSKLFDEGVMRMLKEYGIVLDVLLEPDIPVKEERQRRALLGLSRNSVGYTLWHLIMGKEGLFVIFTMKSIPVFFEEIANEFELYVKIRADELKKAVGGVWEQLTDVGHRLPWTSYGHSLERIPWSSYHIANYSVSCEGGSIVFRRYYRGYVEEHKIEYSRLMVFLAPAMFLGLAWLRPDESPSLSYYKWW